jgi:predicted  nucleic acid-binding Zn-ribbon protein
MQKGILETSYECLRTAVYELQTQVRKLGKMNGRSRSSLRCGYRQAYRKKRLVVKTLRNKLDATRKRLEIVQQEGARAADEKEKLTQEVQDSAQRHEGYIALLRERLRAAEAARDRANTELDDVHIGRPNILSLEARVEGLEERNRELERKKAALQTDLVTCRRDAQDKIKTLVEEVDSLEGKNSELMKAIVGASTSPNKVADDTIRNMWLQLSYSISNLVETMLIRPSKDLDHLAITNSTRFGAASKKLVPGFLHLLCDDEFVSPLLQTFIWREVFNVVFSDATPITNIWGGEDGCRLRMSIKGMQEVPFEVAMLLTLIPSPPRNILHPPTGSPRQNGLPSGRGSRPPRWLA